ncbi:MAG: RNA polymerase sigma factor [Patescibacteria group bacterium]|nr:RNA polymerase sigma factor [Patescibacteria group bacterium]
MASDAKFKKCYLKHRIRMYWYIYRKISNVGDAEDITADVFMKLYENWDYVSKRNSGAILAWLYTVARNRSIDQLRKKSRRKTIPIGDEETGVQARNLDDFVQQAVKEEKLGLVRKAMKIVSEDELEVLTLRFEEELKFREIAEIVNKDEGACKMMLYRSIRKIRDELYSNSEMK